MCDSVDGFTFVLVLILHDMANMVLSSRLSAKPFSSVVPCCAKSPQMLTQSWDRCFLSFYNFLVLLLMSRYFHVAMTALVAVLAFMLTGCHGILEPPLGDQVRFVAVGLLTDQSNKGLYRTRRCCVHFLTNHLLVFNRVQRRLDETLVPSSGPAPNSFPTQAPATSPTSAPPLSTTPSTPLPTFQPVEMGKFEWDLTRVGTAQISFSEDVNKGEIILDYNISLRDFSISLFEEDCSTQVPSSVVTANGSITKTSSRHGTLTVSLDIIQDTVMGSSIWSPGDVGIGYVNVCIRVDLLDDDQAISVNFLEQKLFVTIGLLQGFEVTTVDLSRVSADEEAGDANVQYELVVCQCDETFECLTSVLAQGSDVYICITALADDVEVIGIQSLSFSQGSFSVDSVVDGVPNILSDVKVLDKKGIVRSQMPSVFFEHEHPDDVIADGYALLRFTGDGGTRFLHSRITTRILNDEVVEGDTSFSLPLAVASSLEDASSAAGDSLMSIMAITMAIFVLQW